MRCSGCGVRYFRGSGVTMTVEGRDGSRSFCNARCAEAHVSVDVKDPGDEEIRKVSSEAAEAISDNGTTVKFVGRLLCGCDVAGEVRSVTQIRIGSHGQWCEKHDRFELFEDVIVARPLTDTQGKV